MIEGVARPPRWVARPVVSLSGPLSNARIDSQVGVTTLASTLPSHHDHLTAGKIPSPPTAHISSNADPDLFAHILRYWRRGVLPVVYGMRKVTHGFDHAFYKALQEEAEDFGIELRHPRLTQPRGARVSARDTTGPKSGELTC